MSFNVVEFLKSFLDLSTAEYLRQVWAGDMSELLIEVIIDVIGILIVCTFLLVLTLYLIWILRKVIARIQDRIGPNRVGGRYGLLQTVADAIKLITKEDIVPSGADKVPR